MSPVEKVLLARTDRLPNPYTHRAVRDARLFKGRETEMEVVTDILRGARPLLVIYGASGVGKTSLLKYMHDHILAQHGFVPVLVGNMRSFTRKDFWQRVATDADDALLRTSTAGSERNPFASAVKRPEADSLAAFKRGLHAARRMLRGRTLVLMVDELTLIEERWPKDEASHVLNDLESFIDYIDDGDVNIKVVLCRHKPLYRGAGRDRVNFLPLLGRAVPFPLDHLDRPAAERLIREPLGPAVTYDPRAEDRILYFTGRHPFFLHVLLGELILQLNSKRRRDVRVDDVDAVVLQPRVA